MLETFRVAKITPPQPSTLVKRPTLLSLLNRRTVLTMVITHAGCGKTTLAADYVSSLTSPVAWYSLEEADGDFSQFANYLIKAIQRVAPDFGNAEGYTFNTLLNQADQTLNKTTVPVSLVQRLADAFVHDLDLLKNRKALSEFWLVLDDYQLAQSITNTVFLQQVIRWLSPGYHIIMLSRQLPDDFPFARLVSQGYAQIIGPEQLIFTQSEVENLVEQSFGMPNNVLARRLLDFTQGWAVSLNLTITSLKQARLKREYLTLDLEQSFTRWLQELESQQLAPSPAHLDEPLFNYLASVLLKELDPERQLFLFQTCLLDVLSESNCNAVTGSAESLNHLLALEQMQLFVTRLDASQNLFRYHALTKAFLQLGLANKPELSRQTYLNTAALYEKIGQYQEAITCWLKVGAITQAVDYLNNIALEVYEKGKLRLLQEMLNQLPLVLTEQRANLVNIRGLLAQDAGLYEASYQLFLKAKQLYEQQKDFDLAAIAAAMAASLQCNLGNYALAQEEAKKWLDYRGESKWAKLAKGIANLTVGVANQRLGQFEEAEHHFTIARQVFSGVGDSYRVNITNLHQAELYYAKGSLIKARKLFQQSLAYWQGFGNLSREIYVSHMLNLILKRLGKYLDAIKGFEENLGRLRELGSNYLEPYTWNELADCYRDMSQLEQADFCYAKAEELTRNKNPDLEIEILTGRGINYWLWQQPSRAFELYEEANELIVDYKQPNKKAGVNLALGLAELDRRRFDIAAQYLQTALQNLKQYSSPSQEGRCLLLLATTKYYQKQNTEAFRLLNASLAVFNSSFFDPYLPCELERATPLLLEALKQPSANPVLQELVNRRGIRPSTIISLPTRKSEGVQTLKLELFGLNGGGVFLNGVKLDNWKWSKAQWLLYYLVEHPNSNTDKLQTEFWAEEQEVKTNAVHALISELRKSIKPIEVVSKNRAYSLALEKEACHYDVFAFESSLRELLRQGSKASITALESSLALHRQPYLGEVDLEWVEARRRELLNLYLKGTVLLAKLRSDERNYYGVIEAWNKFLVYDPYYEEAHQAIIKSYKVLGQESEARRSQHNYEVALKDLYT